jgi:Ca-activated chloride channel family protein
MIQLSTPYLLLAALPIIGGILFLLLRQKTRPVLRSVALLLLLLALAGPRIAEQSAERNVVFLIDRSASVTLTSDDNAIRAAVQRIVSEHPEWSFATVEFAGTAALAVPLGSSVFPLGVIQLDGTASNLDAAIELGLSILPEGEANQFVLVSDGLFTDNADVALSAAQLAGVPISVLPIGSPPGADAALVSIHGPSQVSVDRPFSIDIEIESTRAVDATLVVYRDDELLSFAEASLGEGITRFSVDDSFDEPVAHTYQAIVKALDDPIPNNDALSLLVTATDLPPVLVVDRLGESMVSALVESLGLGFTRSEAIPSLEVLSSYRQVVLTGLSFTTLTVDELDAIGSFVRSLGGGLLVVEGEEEVRGIGEGGIEELLPVSYTLPEKSREAQLALVYVLDRSSSMRSRVSGVEKIEILKEAAAASAALLDATTQVGIIAFNLEHEWIVPIATVGSSAIYDALRGLEAIGGTDVYYPIVEALDRLEEIEVPAKHILLISDGKTVDEVRNYPGLVRRMQELEDVTLSAIGVGQTMNVSLLSALVEAGGGTLYRADDFSLLPQISIQATQRISRQRFIDGPVEVFGRLRERLGASDVPPLGGYVLTYPKPTADTSLWAGEDPIVSTWRVGLGAATVLNTDLVGLGSEEWLAWPGLSELFEAILATTEPVLTPTLGLSTSIVRHPDTLELLVDARNDDRTFANFLDLDVELLPEGTAYELVQMGPGLYVASFPTPPQGGYALHVIDHARQRALTLPLTVPYPIEYRELGPDSATLARVAEATGGLLLEDGARLPTVSGGASTKYSPLHVALLLAALGVFLLDLIVRKWPSRALRTR